MTKLKDLKIGDCFCFPRYKEYYIILDTIERNIYDAPAIMYEVYSVTDRIIYYFFGSYYVTQVTEEAFFEEEKFRKKVTL